jgi:hypothetical protein
LSAPQRPEARPNVALIDFIRDAFDRVFDDDDPVTLTIAPHTHITLIYKMADRQANFAISLFGSAQGDGPQDAAAPSRVQQALVDFVMDFHLDNIFIYRFVARIGFAMSIADPAAEIKSVRTCW